MNARELVQQWISTLDEAGIEDLRRITAGRPYLTRTSSVRAWAEARDGLGHSWQVFLSERDIPDDAPEGFMLSDGFLAIHPAQWVGCRETRGGSHQYQTVVCPRCGAEFCWACSGPGTNLHEGGKYTADVLECPLCGHNCA